MRKDVIGVVERLKSNECSQVGLIFGSNSWEYPYWMRGRELLKNPLHLEHLLVDNPSARQTSESYQAFQPCALLVVPGKGGDRPRLSVNGVTFEKQWQGSKVSVFVRRSPA